jgi:hypothetical protein
MRSRTRVVDYSGGSPATSETSAQGLAEFRWRTDGDRAKSRSSVTISQLTGTAAKHRDGGHGTRIARVAQLALKSGVDDLLERLAAIACQPLGRRQEFVGDGDRGAHDGQRSASSASHRPLDRSVRPRRG